MNVSSGISQKTPNGDIRSLKVQVSWYDLVDLVREGKVAGYALDVEDERPIIIDEGTKEKMPVAEVFDNLRKLADKLLIAWMVREDLITADSARAQMAEIGPLGRKPEADAG